MNFSLSALFHTNSKVCLIYFGQNCRRVVQKTAEATGDLIGNKLADKITSVGKTKKIEEIYIPPEKRQQISDDLKLF